LRVRSAPERYLGLALVGDSVSTRQAAGKAEQALRVQRWREKHPDRAAELAKRNSASVRAMVRLKARHVSEFEQLMREECERSGIPRFFPRLPPELDGRTTPGGRSVNA
jgi:hypothetical protein